MTNSGEATPDAAAHAGDTQRLDKWLWYARVFKSRTLAAGLVADGKVRVNRARVTKPSHAVRPGDVLTIAMRGGVQVLKIIAPGTRRGPPAEARQLYELISSSIPAAETARNKAPAGAATGRDPGTGRPTKRDRRMIDRFGEPD